MPVVRTSLAEILAGLDGGHRAVREPMAEAPGKSGAGLELLTIDDARYVLKRIDRHDDWTLRVAGLLEAAPVQLWRSGTLDRLPECFIQPIVDVAVDAAGVTWLLMLDISDTLFANDGSPITLEAHRQLLDHMAVLSAAWWDRPDIPSVVEPMTRYLELSPWMGRTEAELRSPHPVPRLVVEGWDHFAAVAPAVADIVMPLAWDPSPLVAALDTTPQTFVHGNWKLDNLGIDPSGRTVLFDWETPGRGTACAELAWYLAINCDRLPISKEATIAEFRDALEGHGVDTTDWWDRQLALALLGGLVHFGWEKALGGHNDELEWWEMHAHAARRHLA
jgi:hypothetical protein